VTDLATRRRSVVTGSALARLRAWVADVEAWPVGSHVWGHYAEQTDAGPVACRTENVSACHGGVRRLVDGPLRAVAAEALGTDVTAFKDKLNYKRPGGAGFRPHQDLLAYPGVARVLSVLVAVDPCTATSGCLWLAAGVQEALPTDDRGVVRDDVATSLRWEPVELAPGDAVCIGGLAPHFSEANRSASPRRVLVASYAPTEDGYRREDYYDARRRTMERAASLDGQFRISTLADFEGVEVPVAGRADSAGGCVHA